ncbi:MAG: ATP-binding protein [Candidatus Thorarchaeota archaeon]
MPTENDWTREELERDYVATMTAVTLPIDLKIEGQTHIYNLKQAEAILRNAKLISLGICSCRVKLQKCDGPLEVCIGMDREAEILIAKGQAKQVSLEEALGALRYSHDAGLVHIAYTDKGAASPFIICSCCACCCHSLAGLIRFEIPDAVVASEFVAMQNNEECTHCGICVNRCQFQARSIDNGTLMYDSSKCFGCGVCLSTCPSNAISLVNRNKIESQKD